jgi:signal transduction histidine kinase
MSTPAWTRRLAWTERLLPRTLRGRIMLTMAAGVLVSQLLGLALWAWQLNETAQREAAQAARQLALSAVGATRFFSDLPVQYRPLLIEQLRTMGGTRFFLSLNRGRVPVTPLAETTLLRTVTTQVLRTLRSEQSGLVSVDAAFSWAEDLAVTDDGRMLGDMPDRWVEGATLLLPRPAPLLVIQIEFEPGGWLMLVTTMPDPYFLDNANPLTRDRVLLYTATLVTVLLLVLVVARSLTRPLQRLADAASAFGQGRHPNPVPERGTVELRRTARAFNDMQGHLQRFMEDRERLFRSISHDLKTPIMRLKLRTELLDDDAVRADFHEDLDELDMMVKGALQTVKDSDIHENLSEVRLDRLLDALTAPARAHGTAITLDVPPVTVWGKPLALKRALGNLLDNAVRYAGGVEVSVKQEAGRVAVVVRDHGPGLPEASLEEVFEPYVRLEHGREAYGEGSGLGLGIARDIVRAHGGELTLANAPGGGLVATAVVPERAPFGHAGASQDPLPG